MSPEEYKSLTEELQKAPMPNAALKIASLENAIENFYSLCSNEINILKNKIAILEEKANIQTQSVPIIEKTDMIEQPTIAKKIARGGVGTFWINNGEENKRWRPSNGPMPEGFHKGQLHKPVVKPIEPINDPIEGDINHPNNNKGDQDYEETNRFVGPDSNVIRMVSIG